MIAEESSFSRPNCFFVMYTKISCSESSHSGPAASLLYIIKESVTVTRAVSKQTAEGRLSRAGTLGKINSSESGGKCEMLRNQTPNFPYSSLCFNATLPNAETCSETSMVAMLFETRRDLLPMLAPRDHQLFILCLQLQLVVCHPHKNIDFCLAPSQLFNRLSGGRHRRDSSCKRVSESSALDRGLM